MENSNNSLKEVHNENINPEISYKSNSYTCKNINYVDNSSEQNIFDKNNFKNISKHTLKQNKNILYSNNSFNYNEENHNNCDDTEIYYENDMIKENDLDFKSNFNNIFKNKINININDSDNSFNTKKNIFQDPRHDFILNFDPNDKNNYNFAHRNKTIQIIKYSNNTVIQGII